MLISFLSLLEKRCVETGVDLKKAVIYAKLPDSTYYRWKSEDANPTFAKAQLVYDAIEKLSNIKF